MSATGDRRGWTAWAAAWMAIVVTSLLAALALAQLSAESSEAALDEALALHLRGEAGLLAASLGTEPLEAIAALGGDRSAAAIQRRVHDLRVAGSLHDAALFGPNALPLGRPEESWVPGKADRGLILAASDGGPQLGPLYRASDGELYRSAYVPVPEHPGWVLGIEGSGATLGAVDRLEDLQLLVGAIVLLLASLVGALLAAAMTRPLHRLDTELDGASPGDRPEVLTLQGPREVRRVALSARRLLHAIRERDSALAEAHQAQLHQLTALAAAVAHEVRNPLHALGITIVGLGRANDPLKQATLTARATACVEEMERIVARFLDLSRPITPRLESVDLAGLVSRVINGMEAPLQAALCGISYPVRTDPELLSQVLRNLLRNATEAGASTVVIHLDAEGIRIEDDGSGVSALDALHLFTWFHTSRAQGTGLGLPQSRRICEALGGDLRLLRQRPATFQISLPRGGPPPERVLPGVS